ncbi:penicillin-binding protein [Candidatus Roizmanbacteria bacterium]|nr:penicillin-binding protein [Candidatus Roizmanbacteria bacterium]
MVSRRLRFARLYSRQRLMHKTLIAFIGVIVFGFITTFIVFAWYAKDLPSPGKLSQTTKSSTVFFDRDGKILFELYKDKNRVPVRFDEVSERMRQATIAIEDKNFYKHKGISQAGIIRAIFSIIFRGNLQGGSTITQQLIKNVLLGQQRTLPRKIKEVILAVVVERRYTKDEILEMYLNEAPYGGSYWGIGSASRGYFDKSPKDLTIVESAVLAGFPQSPSKYSPFIGKKDAWRSRAKDVLRRMREDRYITRQEEKEAIKQLQTMKFTTPKLSINAPHFVFYVRDLIEKEFGPKILDQGIRVKTTLSLDVQKNAEEIVKKEIKSLKGYRVGNGAAVVLDSKTGEILAMVGAYDFNDEKYGNFNAALGLRQPGSAIKPVTYAVAFEKGYTPATVVVDLRTVFPDQGGKEYIPVNYDGKYRGPIQLRFGLGNSINLVAVKLLAMVGLRDFMQKADDMGLKTLGPTKANLDRFGLAITLGGGETTLLDLTNAYAVFARGGIYKDVQSIVEIKDFRGKTLFKRKKTSERRVVSPEASFLVSHVLSDNVARTEIFGPRSYLNIPGKTVAVKTGTTNDKRDNWTLGYTNDVAVGVWVGNNDNSPMNPQIASGITGASPIWYNIMVTLLRKYKDGITAKPDGVEAVTIDSFLGGLPKDGGSTRSEYFKKGTTPKDVSPFYKKVKISKANGKLANDVEIRRGEYEEKECILITENDPVSNDGKNRWQEAINEWAKQQADDKYKCPQETSDASSDSVAVSIKSPEDKSTVSANNVEIKAKLTSLDKIKNVKIYVNGSEVKNIDGNRDEINETLNLSDGAYELKVVAKNEKDKSGESTIRFGVNKPWDFQQTTPSPTP